VIDSLQRSNCLIFAVRRWMREGGYFIVRKSRHGWWPHFMWARSLKGLAIEQWIPCPPKKWDDLPRWQKILPVHVVLFRGQLKRDDD